MTVYSDGVGTVVSPDIRDPLFSRLLQRVDGTFDGTLPRPMTGGAHYYANVAHVTSCRFKTEILGKPEGHPKVVVCGAHSQ